jgi:hypothetical protein
VAGDASPGLSGGAPLARGPVSAAVAIYRAAPGGRATSRLKAGAVEQTWEKWFLQPMDTKVQASSYF